MSVVLDRIEVLDLSDLPPDQRTREADRVAMRGSTIGTRRWNARPLEERLRVRGMSERELIEFGNRVSSREPVPRPSCVHRADDPMLT
jgi:hypothetical protein